MRTRQEQWMDMSVMYERSYLKKFPAASEFAAVCRMLSEAPWAADLRPWLSLNVLVISTAQDYLQLRRQRSVRLAGNVDGEISASFHKSSARRAIRVERIVSISEDSLRPLASWACGKD